MGRPLIGDERERGERGGHAGGGLLRAVEEAGEVEHDFGTEDGFDLLVRAFEGLEHVEHEDERVDGHGLGEQLGVLLRQGAQVDLLVHGQAVYLEHDRVLSGTVTGTVCLTMR